MGGVGAGWVEQVLILPFLFPISPLQLENWCIDAAL